MNDIRLLNTMQIGRLMKIHKPGIDYTKDSKWECQWNKSIIQHRDTRQIIENVIYTSPALAKGIIDFFQPNGMCLDPCRGGGAFYKHLPKPKDWCELQEGRDFFDYKKAVDWIITNPICFSEKLLSDFLAHAKSISKNVVLLVPISSIVTSSMSRVKNLKAIYRFNFSAYGARNAFRYSDGSVFNMRNKNSYGCCHWVRDYEGPCTIYEFNKQIPE